VTPAAVAVVSAMPLNIQIENRKLPKKESKKKRRLSVRVNGSSPCARNVHGSIATEAIANRKNARANTGMTATSGFDSATYVPTSAIEAVSSKYENDFDDGAALFIGEAKIPDASHRFEYVYIDELIADAAACL
jgi:hypothetical protein